MLLCDGIGTEGTQNAAGNRMKNDFQNGYPRGCVGRREDTSERNCRGARSAFNIQPKPGKASGAEKINFNI